RKKEELIFLDRATDVAAVFVLMVRRDERGEVILRIEIGIPEKFEHAAVKLARSRFQNVVVESLSLIFRLLTVDFHLELVDGIDRHRESDRTSVAHLVRERNRQVFKIQSVNFLLTAIERRVRRTSGLQYDSRDARRQAHKRRRIAWHALVHL